MSVLVWVNAWDLGSSPISIGDEMEWSLGTVRDRDWLAAVVGDEVAAAIDYTWDGQSDGRLGAVTRVQIVAIQSAHARYAPFSNQSRLFLSSPGTWMLSPRARADGREAGVKDSFLSGYIFEILTRDPPLRG